MIPQEQPNGEQDLREAYLWEPVDEQSGSKTVVCKLCAFHCKLKPNAKGVCQVRINVDGRLYSLNYSSVVAANVDPIEKKPLFHFQPGTMSFSYAAAGCNFRCSFCQNWQISQAPREFGVLVGQPYTPQRMVQTALRRRCASVAHTYTEPTVFFELAYDTAKLATEAGLKNVFVSNGFMTTEALEMIGPYLHGVNVDLKSFRDGFYRQIARAMLEPVLDTLRYLVHKTDIWVEVTTLVVPHVNDSDAELSDIARFIAEELSVDVPWHISRYHPDYKFNEQPPTPMATLRRAYELGKQAGLRYVYLGNVPGDEAENTYCHNCSQLLIGRYGFSVTEMNVKDGKCTRCGARLPGVDLP